MSRGIFKMAAEAVLWQNGLGRHFENGLGDYRVIITSTATNQRGEFSIITYIIILKVINLLKYNSEIATYTQLSTIDFICIWAAAAWKKYIYLKNMSRISTFRAKALCLWSGVFSDRIISLQNCRCLSWSLPTFAQTVLNFWWLQISRLCDFIYL